MIFTVIMLAAGLCAASAAYAQPSADTLQTVRPFGTHALELLAAREPGVEVVSTPGAPGMTPTIHVRGFGVLPGIEPVYVVDGMRRRNLDDLAPESIERIEVLKDASAMGLWGPDAAAGVVVVTTNRATRKGFHAGYSFQGGLQRVAHEPEPMTFAEWSNSWRGWVPFPESEYEDAHPAAPEVSFLQSHLLSAQYGGERLSAVASLTVMDNDGPYPGRKDTQRRYAANWSAEYRPLSWLTLETTGRWGRTSVSKAPEGWLKEYLADYPKTPRDDRREKATETWGLSGTVVQGKVEVRPLPGLFVRGTGGYSHDVRDQYQAKWTAYGSDEWLNALAGYEGKKWFQWGAEAGWTGAWRGHRLRLGATFRRMVEKQDNRILGGTAGSSGSGVILADAGLTFGDDANVEERLLLPGYQRYLDNGGGLDGLLASKLSKMNVGTPEMEWKEAVATAGYDWKGRYQVDFSYFRAWKDKLFSEEGYRIPAVTVGWALSEEPLLRRALPAWWKTWTVSASWSEAGPFIPILDDLARWAGANIAGFSATDSASTDARHRDITTALSFQAGRTGLDLSASWYVNDDGLTRYYAYFYSGLGVSNQLISGDQRMYEVRNQGVELSGNLRGGIGSVRYALSGYMTLYQNRVTFSENLKKFSAMHWGNESSLWIQDGKPLGGALLYHMEEDGQVKERERLFMGSAFPSMTGGFRASVGWKDWQLTVSGHGDRGQTIQRNGYYDALSRYYMEQSLSGKYGEPWTLYSSIDAFNSDVSLLDGSFFRIDQIRLDYALPLRKVRLDLFASLENWFLFTKYPGSDPELALAWDGLGLETANYPSTRRTVFGLKVGF